MTLDGRLATLKNAYNGQERWAIENVQNQERKNENIDFKGKREKFYSPVSSANSYLDELITWRDTGYQMFWHKREFRKILMLPRAFMIASKIKEFVFSAISVKGSCGTLMGGGSFSILPVELLGDI